MPNKTIEHGTNKPEDEMKPQRSNDKYWIGTNSFDNLQYSSDLDEYICHLEERMENRLDSLVADRIAEAIFLQTIECVRENIPFVVVFPLEEVAKRTKKIIETELNVKIKLKNYSCWNSGEDNDKHTNVGTGNYS